jgi:hypothetical protein
VTSRTLQEPDGKTRNAYWFAWQRKLLVTSAGRPRVRWNDIINTDIRIGNGCMWRKILSSGRLRY